MTKQFRKETGNNFLVEFHPNTPTHRIFSMWEKELTGLIKHFYPEIDFEEMLTLKHIIYLIRDFGRRAVPLWETMLGLEHDIKSSCKTIDDARGVVSHLVDKKILSVVIIKCEYYSSDGQLVHSDMVPSLELLDVIFLDAAIAVIKDVFDLWTRVKKGLHKQRISVKPYRAKTVGSDELNREIAFNGYDSGATYFAPANVPPEAVSMDERLLSEKSLPRPKDNDLVAQVIDKFYPILDEKQKCYLNYFVRTKYDSADAEEVPVRLLEHEHQLFQKQTEIDRVEQELCDNRILNRKIFRFVDFFNGDNFSITSPRKNIQLNHDFWKAVFALEDKVRNLQESVETKN